MVKATAFETVKCSGFTAKYFGSCVVTKTRHPRYEIISAHEKRTRNAIHSRRLKLCTGKEEDLSVSVIVSKPQNYSGLSESKEEYLESYELGSEHNETKQSPPDDERNRGFRIAALTGLLQLATLETNAFHVYYYLPGVARIISEFHPPEVPTTLKE